MMQWAGQNALRPWILDTYGGRDMDACGAALEIRIKHPWVLYVIRACGEWGGWGLQWFDTKIKATGSRERISFKVCKNFMKNGKLIVDQVFFLKVQLMSIVLLQMVNT